LVITQSFAGMVLPLSTRASQGHLVSLSAAFFREWRFSRHTLLFVLLSFACLASSSESLNSYAIFPNNYLFLAGFGRPYCLSTRVLSVFHNIPGQSFAFYNKVHRSQFYCLLTGVRFNYQEVLSQLLHILLDTEYNTPSVFPLARYSTVFQVSGIHLQL
jgi:hypothetical protein